MPATPINQTVRYFHPEVTKVYFLPAVVSATLNPTRAEITAGKDLTAEIADASGWGVKSGTIDVQDWGSKFVAQIGGRITTESSSITFYADKTGDDIRKDLPRDTVGFVVWCDGGDVAAQPCDVFPVTVTSVGKVRSGTDGARMVTVDFAITRVPGEDRPLPALT